MLRLDTARKLVLLILSLFISFSAWAGNGVGDEDDNYTKPCAATSHININGCTNLTVISNPTGPYLRFALNFSYLYEYDPIHPFLDPMYMEASLTSSAGNPLNLYADPSIMAGPPMIGNKKLISAPLSINPTTGRHEHIFFIELFVHNSAFPPGCEVHLNLNFFDMTEPLLNIIDYGIPVAELQGSPQNGDIIVMPDDSYYHYENNIETILVYQNCCSPVPSTPEDPSGGNDGGMARTTSFTSETQFAPNPVSEFGVLTYETLQTGTVELSLFDAAGKQYFNYSRQDQVSVGIHRQKLDMSELPTGIYFIHIRLNGDIQTQKILKY